MTKTTAPPRARERIVAAAHDLFVAHGYAATTIESIATEADVGTSTVYAIFGSKRELLAALRRRWFDAAEVEPLVAEALATTDAREKLRLCAAWVRRQLELGQEVIALFEEAQRVEPELGPFLAELRKKAEAKIDELVRSLEPSLARDVTTRDAAAVIWALTHGAVYRELVHTRGWRPQRFEAWLADALQYQLLGCPSRVG